MPDIKGKKKVKYLLSNFLTAKCNREEGLRKNEISEQNVDYYLLAVNQIRCFERTGLAL